MRALAVVVPVAVLVLSGAPAALAAPPGGPAPADPSTGLAVLRTEQAGAQTLTTTADPLIQRDTTTEPSLAVDPLDPRHVVAGYQMGRDDAGGDISNGFAVTQDGGRTWVDGTVPGLTSLDPVSPASPYTRASDAVVAFGPPDAATGQSLVYFSSLVFDPTGPNLRSAIVNSTSHDGGRTWDLPTVVQDDLGGGLNDKNWVVVDTGSGPGHHQGRVYVVWDRVAGVIAKYSDDQGRTWVGPPSPAYTPNVYAGQGIGSLPLVLPSGQLAVLFSSSAVPAITNPSDELAQAEQGVSKLSMAVTALPAADVPTGAPLAFAPPTTIATFNAAAVRHQRAGGLLSAAVDPASGAVYMAVEDTRFRSDGNNDAVLYRTANPTGTTPSWTETRVNGGPRDDQVDHYDPAVAVGPGGTVRVMWRQRQESASTDVTTYDTYVSTWAAQSTDGGATFRPALRVDQGVNDVRYGAFSRGGTFQGDYDQLATASDGTTYVVHCDALPLGDAAPALNQVSATTVHHQRTFVTVLAAADAGPAPVVPELPSAPAGLLAAAALGATTLAVRRRRA